MLRLCGPLDLFGVTCLLGPPHDVGFHIGSPSCLFPSQGISRGASQAGYVGHASLTRLSRSGMLCCRASHDLALSQVYAASHRVPSSLLRSCTLYLLEGLMLVFAMARPRMQPGHGPPLIPINTDIHRGQHVFFTASATHLRAFIETGAQLSEQQLAALKACKEQLPQPSSRPCARSPTSISCGNRKSRRPPSSVRRPSTTLKRTRVLGSTMTTYSSTVGLALGDKAKSAWTR